MSGLLAYSKACSKEFFNLKKEVNMEIPDLFWKIHSFVKRPGLKRINH
jgi:hypothetical protein